MGEVRAEAKIELGVSQFIAHFLGQRATPTLLLEETERDAQQYNITTITK